jgi:hypothetical protein
MGSGGLGRGGLRRFGERGDAASQVIEVGG